MTTVLTSGSSWNGRSLPAARVRLDLLGGLRRADVAKSATAARGALWGSHDCLPCSALPMPDLVMRGEKTGQVVARDALQAGNEVARLKTALRKVLGQHINRDVVGDERGDVIGNARRLRLPPAAERQPSRVLPAGRVIDSVAAQ